MHLALCVDQTPNTLAAARFTRDLLLPPESRVSVVVVDDPSRPVNLADLLKTQDRVLSIMDFNNIRVLTFLYQGREADQVLAYSRRFAPDLLLVSANGLRNYFGIFLGGSAQRVVDSAKCPVLVARAPYVRLRHVLLTADCTWSSMHAARYLAAMPLDAEVRITVLHVQPPEPDLEAVITRPWQLRSEQRMPLKRLRSGPIAFRTSHGVMRYATEVMRAADRDVVGVMAKGDEVTEIARYASEHAVDLIVAGAHALDGIPGWLMSDSTRQLIHSVGCSVLVVKESTCHDE